MGVSQKKGGSSDPTNHEPLDSSVGKIGLCFDGFVNLGCFCRSGGGGGSDAFPFLLWKLQQSSQVSSEGILNVPPTQSKIILKFSEEPGPGHSGCHKASLVEDGAAATGFRLGC